MGFDLSGIKPTSEEGHAFRANVWYWRPIWAFIKQELPDLLTPAQVRGGVCWSAKWLFDDEIINCSVTEEEALEKDDKGLLANYGSYSMKRI